MDKIKEAKLLILKVLKSRGKISENELVEEVRRAQGERFWDFRNVGRVVRTTGIDGVPDFDDIVAWLHIVGYIRSESRLEGIFFKNYYEITEEGKKYLEANGDFKILLTKS